MRTLLFVLALLVAGPASPLPAQSPWYGPQPDRWDDARYDGYSRVRLWVEDERDYFRRGDRLPVRFSTTDDSYVALVHVDTEGNLDFLYPLSPWDDGYVRGGRVHTLPRGYQSGWTVRGRPGIGYLYLIASPVPLDFRYFARRGGSWDWSYAGRSVHGDPFWAMEQITRMLVPDPYVPYAVDYYSYYVEGRFRYPQYACSDRGLGLDRGWGWYPSYGGCDHLDGFLREHPYYYDARLYRGDRRAYFRERYGDTDPRHGYKEPLDRGARSWDASPQRGVVPRASEPQRREPLPRDARPTARPAPERGGSSGRGSEPARRPALERRGGERSGSGAVAAPARGRPVPRAGRGSSERPAPAGRVAPRPRGTGSDTLRIQR